MALVVIAYPSQSDGWIAMNVDNTWSSYQTYIDKGARVYTNEELAKFGITEKDIPYICLLNTKVLPNFDLVYTPDSSIIIGNAGKDYIDSETGITFKEYYVSPATLVMKADRCGSQEKPFLSVAEAISTIAPLVSTNLFLEHIKLNLVNPETITTPVPVEHQDLFPAENLRDSLNISLQYNHSDFPIKSIYLKGEFPYTVYLRNGIEGIGIIPLVILEDLRFGKSGTEIQNIVEVNSDESTIPASLKATGQRLILRGHFEFNLKDSSRYLINIVGRKNKLEISSATLLFKQPEHTPTFEEGTNTAPSNISYTRDSTIFRAYNGGEINCMNSTIQFGTSAEPFGEGGTILNADAGDIRFSSNPFILSEGNVQSFVDANKWRPFIIQNNGTIDTKGGGPNFAPGLKEASNVGGSYF